MMETMACMHAMNLHFSTLTGFAGLKLATRRNIPLPGRESKYLTPRHIPSVLPAIGSSYVHVRKLQRNKHLASLYNVN